MRDVCSVVAVALAMTACWPSTAAVRTIDPTASIRIDGATQIVAGGFSGDFSLILHLRPDALPEQAEGIVEVEGLARLSLGPAGELSAFVNASPAPVQVSLPGALEAGQWSLIALSWDSATSALTVHEFSDGQPVQSATASSPGAVAPTEHDDLWLGAGPSNALAAQGVYGVVALRDHVVSAADISDLAASRRFDAAIDLDNRAAGGAMNGVNGLLWAGNYAVLVAPIKLFSGAEAPEPGVVAYPATRRSLVTRHASTNLVAGVFEVKELQGFEYVSHHEVPFPSPFDRVLPATGVSTQPIPGLAPNARSLFRGPQGLVRVIASSNSRGVRRREQLDSTPNTQVGPPRPGSYIGGFCDVYRDQVAGVMMIPAERGIGAYFGFSTFEDNPRFSGTIRDVKNSDTQNRPWSDFARFWSGSSSADARGPGTGSILSDGARFALKCRPEGMILATEPLEVRAVVLRFPGASDVQWTSAKEEKQKGGVQVVGSTPGVDLFITELDSTRVIIPVTQEDEVVSASQLALIGDHTADVLAGDAVFFPSIYGVGPISLVQSVSFDGARTSITLEHPLGGLPEVGDPLRFGPWEHVELTYTWPALAPDDPKVWRGLELTCIPETGRGVVVFEFAAHRPGVDGFVVGFAGWSGNGYQVQMDRSFDAATRSWMALTRADLWLQVPAQQDSPPASMSGYLQFIRDALPACDVVWAGEPCQGTQLGADVLFTDWHQYIRDNAAAEGVVGLSMLEHPDFGTFREQMADGLRIDEAHFSHRGNMRIAQEWISMLESAALLPGDANRDGAVNFDDVNAVLGGWVTSPGPFAGGDVTGDGAVDFADLQAVLTYWGVQD